jgi:hypothetical protein
MNNGHLRMTQTMNYMKHQQMTQGLRSKYQQLHDQKRAEVGNVKRIKSEQK